MRFSASFDGRVNQLRLLSRAMSKIRRKLSPLVSGLTTSPARQAISRRMLELRRTLRGAAHRVEYFHQVDDPYCQLVAPLLEQLIDRYEVELVPVLVGPPDNESAPEREHLVAYSRKDTAAIAPYYGTEFPDPGEQPPAQLVTLANAILAANMEAEQFAVLAAAVGEALWARDAASLTLLGEEYGATDPDTVERAIEGGNEHREKLGHYLGATFHYAGEWYWGIERLVYLEDRLEELGAIRDAGAARLVERNIPDKLPAVRDPRELSLEFYPSLRSPYTAISFEPVAALIRNYGVELVLRPVLPMVMRGLPVPPSKSRYIVKDTKREAERAGISFGVVADPVGRPVELGYSLYAHACEQGKGFEFLHAFAHLAFAAGVDLGEEAGLKQACERAGLDWSEARPHLGNEDWRELLEANRLALLERGLWGVPSFRLLGPGGVELLATWGQDRIWLVEQEIQKYLAGSEGRGG